MRRVFAIGKFYGATPKQVKTPAFEFAEVEDFVNGRRFALYFS